MGDRSALEEEIKGRRNDHSIIDEAVKGIRKELEKEEGGMKWMHGALMKGDEVFQKFKDEEFKGTQEQGEKAGAAAATAAATATATAKEVS